MGFPFFKLPFERRGVRSPQVNFTQILDEGEGGIERGTFTFHCFFIHSQNPPDFMALCSAYEALLSSSMVNFCTGS